jgi:uncharacterized protein (DUF2147 family)
MLHRPRNIMRSVACSSLLLAIGLVPATAADPTGDWRVADGVANIRVAECNGNMWGAVAWEKTPGGRDINNPDVSKQSRPSLAMPILINMKKKPGVDAWEGQVYNAKDGQMYSSTIKPVSADRMEIQGCVLGFLCGGETWTRVAPPIPRSPVNSMAKGAPRTAGAPPKAVAQPTTATAPNTTGSVNPASKPAQKQAAGQPGDIGDICLLPDIARFAH